MNPVVRVLTGRGRNVSDHASRGCATDEGTTLTVGREWGARALNLSTAALSVSDVRSSDVVGLVVDAVVRVGFGRRPSSC